MSDNLELVLKDLNDNLDDNWFFAANREYIKLLRDEINRLRQQPSILLVHGDCADDLFMNGDFIKDIYGSSKSWSLATLAYALGADFEEEWLEAEEE